MVMGIASGESIITANPHARVGLCMSNLARNDFS
jgi:hypothetical protein